MAARRQTLVGLAGAAVGVLLFAVAVDRVGVQPLTEGVRRVGWGLAAILAIAGTRFVLRAQCWRLCLPRGVRLEFPRAFSAFLAGDAVGSVTPLGLFASEPTKVLLTRHHLATADSVSSLTLENLLYSVSVLVMLACGLMLLLATVAVPSSVRWVVLASLAATLAAAGSAFAMLRWAPFTGGTTAGWRGRLLGVRNDIAAFARDHPRRLALVFSLQMVFHVLAVAETFLTLEWLLGARSPTLVQAIVFETANRLTTVAFKFVPFRLGVDEAASGVIAPLVGVTAAAGVTLAVVRRARVLFWSAVGLVLVATHPSRAARRPEVNLCPRPDRPVPPS